MERIMPKMMPLLRLGDHHRGVLLQKSYIKRKVAKIVLEVVALVVTVLLVIIGRTVLIASAKIVILV
jgi:uncharacterized membrane protein